MLRLTQPPPGEDIVPAIYEANPKLRSLTNTRGDVLCWSCPLCRICWEREGRGSGFVKAGALRHVYACWEKSVAKRGYTIGIWSERRSGYRLHPIKTHPKDSL